MQSQLPRSSHGEAEVAEAAAFVRQHTSFAPRLGLVLGSGLGAMANAVAEPTVLPFAELPHMPRPRVAGHKGELVLGRLGGAPVALLSGRVHAYEGHDQAAVTFGVRLLAALGCRQLLVTNAAGGLNPHFAAGDLMVIADQINGTGTTPLRGPNDDALGPRFVDMTRAFCPEGRAAWGRAAAEVGIELRCGTYYGVLGPSYETPSEVRAYRLLGGDAVGMSTTSEVLMARHRGLSVAGLSVITNMGAGLGAGALSHDEVTQVAREIRGRAGELLVAMCRQWAPPA